MANGPGQRAVRHERGESSAPTRLFDDIPERFRQHLVGLKERTEQAEARSAAAEAEAAALRGRLVALELRPVPGGHDLQEVLDRLHLGFAALACGFVATSVAVVVAMGLAAWAVRIAQAG